MDTAGVPGEPRVGRRLDGAARRRVAARAHAAGDRVAEARARVVAVAGEPVVEPLADRVAHPLVRRAAVVAASVPEHPDGAAGRGDLPGGGVGLVEPEQGVRLALDDQRRRGDPVRDRGGGGAAQELGGGGGEPAGGGGLGVGGAEGGGEAAAGGRDAAAHCVVRRARRLVDRSLDRPARTTARGEARREEHPGPAALEHAVRARRRRGPECRPAASREPRRRSGTGPGPGRST